MRRQRLGIMGGTFDPIHNGHLAIARAAMDAMALDRVLFIPDYLPPHKAAGWAPAGDRMAMTLLATMDEPRFLVSDMELVRKGPSYTVDTMRSLHRRWHRFYDLYFIIGGDRPKPLIRGTALRKRCATAPSLPLDGLGTGSVMKM